MRLALLELVWISTPTVDRLSQTIFYAQPNPSFTTPVQGAATSSLTNCFSLRPSLDRAVMKEVQSRPEARHFNEGARSGARGSSCVRSHRATFAELTANPTFTLDKFRRFSRIGAALHARLFDAHGKIELSGLSMSGAVFPSESALGRLKDESLHFRDAP